MELETGRKKKKKKEDRLNVPTGWDGDLFMGAYNVEYSRRTSEQIAW